MQLDPLREFSLEQLGASEDALDGPFIMQSRALGLLVSLRGKDGGAMPSPSELHWRRDVPPDFKKESVHVFVRRDAKAVYLGMARLLRRGKPATDGFKVAFGLIEPLEEPVWRELVAQANAAPPPAAEEAIASLGERSTTEERIAAMRIFVERWYGALECSVPEAGREAPLALQAFHRLTAGKNVCTQNRLIAPGELAPENESKKLPFYVENQGVCIWATESSGDDPPVYVRLNEGGAPWRKECDSLSSFLIGVLLLEAAMGAPFGASHDGLDSREMARMAKRIQPLPTLAWKASRTRFFGSNGVIGFAHSEGDGASAWIGAKDRVRMEPLEELLADWPDVRC